MIWKILLQTSRLCVFLKFLCAMEVFVDIPNYDEPRSVNVAQCYNEYVFITKLHASAAIVVSVFNSAFPDFAQKKPIFLILSLYSTALYAAASFDNYQYYLRCGNEEDKIRLEKMFFHQQSQACIYGAGSLYLLSNQLMHPIVTPMLPDLSLAFFLAGFANSFLFE